MNATDICLFLCGHTPQYKYFVCMAELTRPLNPLPSCRSCMHHPCISCGPSPANCTSLCLSYPAAAPVPGKTFAGILSLLFPLQLRPVQSKDNKPPPHPPRALLDHFKHRAFVFSRLLGSTKTKRKGKIKWCSWLSLTPVRVQPGGRVQCQVFFDKRIMKLVMDSVSYRL